MKTVWVVYNDRRKDMSSASRFGELKDVFSNAVTNFTKAIEHARRVLSNWKEGDSVLIVGDPTLCAIVVSVALEYADDEVVNVLRWDRHNFEYILTKLDFSDIDPEEDTQLSML